MYPSLQDDPTDILGWLEATNRRRCFFLDFDAKFIEWTFLYRLWYNIETYWNPIIYPIIIDRWSKMI
jgi:hypothetical protein